MSHQTEVSNVFHAYDEGGDILVVEAETLTTRRIKDNPITPPPDTVMSVGTPSEIEDQDSLATETLDRLEDVQETEGVIAEAPDDDATADKSTLNRNPNSEPDLLSNNFSHDALSTVLPDPATEKFCQKWLGTSLMGNPEWLRAQSVVNMIIHAL